jgi:hypothetical protein
VRDFLGAVGEQEREKGKFWEDEAVGKTTAL